MATEPKTTSVDTTIKQKRRGYDTPRRIRELRIGTGNVVGGWEIASNGAFQSEEDDDGFRIVLDSANKKINFEGGVSLQNTATPFSGTGGMAIVHDSGTVMLEVSGDGDGLGSQQVLLKNASESVYIGLQRNLSGTTYLIAGGLPTVNPGGSGRLWNDGGTVKIT